MNIRIYISFILFLFLSSCIAYKADSIIFKWHDKDFKSNYPYKHKNLAENLQLVFKLNKTEYYPGERIEGTLTLYNFSRVDTIFSGRPYYNEEKLYLINEDNLRLRQNHWRVNVCRDGSRIFDAKGRDIVTVSMPKSKLSPLDSIKFTNKRLFEFYGKEYSEANQRFNFPYELPLGHYRAYNYITHIELNRRLQPVLKEIKSNVVEFKIIPRDSSLEEEFKEYLEIINFDNIPQFLKQKNEIEKYLKKYPNGIYKQILQEYYNEQWLTSHCSRRKTLV